MILQSHTHTRSAHHALTALLLAGLVIGAIAPTIGWLEFSSSMENLNLTTALEIRRAGNWLVPTLEGKPRLEKPPLAAWITAALIPDSTLASLSSPDHDRRSAAFEKLQWQVRIAPLLAMGIMLVVSFWIGRVLTNDDEIGVAALLIAGTSLLLLRFARYATTDIYLALWVSVANLLFFLALLKNRWWLGCVGGCAAMGLAFMSKGPPALLQTVLPILIVILFTAPKPRIRLAPLLVGLLTFLLIGGGWYLLVLVFRPEAITVWRSEIAGTENEGTKSYFLIIPYMAPWIAFFVVGLITAVIRHKRIDLFLLTLLILPLLVMSFFRDAQERYMLPMLPIAAVLSANALIQHLRTVRWQRNDLIINVCHWAIVAGIGIAFSIAACGFSAQLQTIDGRPWLSRPLGFSAAGLSAALIFLAIMFQSRLRWLLVAAPVAIMLGMQALFIAGYSHSAHGLAEYRHIAESIWQAAPDAQVYNAHPKGKRPPPEIDLYLNRIVPLIDDASKLQPGVVPKVVLLHPDEMDPDPILPPPWQLLDRHGTKGDRWFAFLLPAIKS